jgi:hypothetical protein
MYVFITSLYSSPCNPLARSSFNSSSSICFNSFSEYILMHHLHSFNSSSSILESNASFNCKEGIKGNLETILGAGIDSCPYLAECVLFMHKEQSELSPSLNFRLHRSQDIMISNLPICIGCIGCIGSIGTGTFSLLSC